jgi:arginyl-tRNA synthetase
MFKSRIEGSANKVALTEDQFEHAATVLGISSVKYFDLHINRTSDYVFSFDKMLNPDGNTGTFLIYGFVRINSIMRKSQFGNPDAIA